ncbi:MULTISPECIES: polymorphic toxin-type HINT domain-containing protein, partial [unclassified Isoptericola]|uniref:polymorphic toxin-type HINT domain-containing protein n=1 Tax=unclassified Isoptericola TaxID=2623355 RepID=UPI00366368E0
GPGDVTAIEDIRAGDKVYAHNLATGADELQLVMETFVRTTTTLYHLTIAGHVVTTTDEHPFMVRNMGWILARDLQPGDILVTPDGTVTLDRIDIEHRPEDDAVTVYNFHVETHHNYYVLAGDLPVLVHNAAHRLPTGVRMNKLVGDAYRDHVADFLRQRGQRVLTDADDAAINTYGTPFGDRIYDISAWNKNGDFLGVVETKSGKVGLDPKQTMKDEWLRDNQGLSITYVLDELDNM